MGGSRTSGIDIMVVESSIVNNIDIVDCDLKTIMNKNHQERFTIGQS